MAKVDFIAVTTDGWSSHSKDRFISVTFHFIDENWRLREIFAAVSHLPGALFVCHVSAGSHDAEATSSVLRKQFERFQVSDKVWIVVCFFRLTVVRFGTTPQSCPQQ